LYQSRGTFGHAATNIRYEPNLVSVQVVKLLTAVAKQRARCVAFAMGMQVRGHDPPGHLWRDKWISGPPATYGVTSG